MDHPKTMDHPIPQSMPPREAWERGLQQGIAQIAQNMLREGIDLTQIVRLTGLSTDRLQSLQSEADESQQIVREFMELSESALDEVWLNPEEDEAWKNL
jgi:predicted transcriptional regulator